MSKKLERKQLVRLVAEAYAASSEAMIQDMATSMDLGILEVMEMFEAAEEEWEEIKDDLARSQGL
jgi:hypothetical protein